MQALITGASSGIGKEIAKYLANLNYELILVARRKELLEELKKELSIKTIIEVCDISNKDNCLKLFNKYKNIDILINNAGFGDFGEFINTDIDKDIAMINTNVITVHTLSKLYAHEMHYKNGGYILNVASIAGFMSGPLMATYYATKNYVVALTKALDKELRKMSSNVKVSLLCPGPVNTNFNNVAGVEFGLSSLSSNYVAKYGIDKMLKGKLIIIPGFLNKLAVFGSKILPWKILSRIVYKMQSQKR